jgi:dihydropteroate synthase
MSSSFIVPHSSLPLDCAGKSLDLSIPRVMGILNVTPDSFSDGGDFISVPAALAQARRMVGEGAAIIDVGGESTRPGAQAVPIEEELRRVIPVIRALAAELPVPISIDTAKPEVMHAAVEAGAGFINDVYALRAPGALAMAAALGVPVCLMHMQGEPRTMQQNPHYDDVVGEVGAFLIARIRACRDAGIPDRQLLIDPGFGFGKTVRHNLQLLNGLDALRRIGLPLLVGLSRKSFLGAVLDAPVTARLHAGLAATTVAVLKGARLIRTHDVGPTVEALRLCSALDADNS